MNPEVVFGDAYSDGRIEVDGDLVRVLESIYPSSRVVRNWRWRLMSKWLAWVQANSRYGSTRNIRHHYDLPTEFYKLWLDELMVYTCAYFPNEDASLEEAQEAKLDLVCRKLWLRPGETVVEAGCGWGSLAMYMAEHYGVKVKAFNISHEQIRVAREMARAERPLLHGRVCGGRLPQYHRPLRRICVRRHVGTRGTRTLPRVRPGDSTYALVIRAGACCISSVAAAVCPSVSGSESAYSPAPTRPPFASRWRSWNRSAIYVLDVEDLRPHYARTIEHWLSRFERAYDSVVHMQGNDFCTHVAAVSCRIHRCLSGGYAAVVPGRICREPVSVGSRDAQPSVHQHQPRTKIRQTTNYGLLRCLNCRRRPSGLLLRLGAAAIGTRHPGNRPQHLPSQQTLRRMDHAAGARGAGIDPEAYAPGRVLQPITGFRLSSIEEPQVDISYGRTISYGILRSEFDEYLLRRCGARIREGVPFDSIERTAEWLDRQWQHQGAPCGRRGWTLLSGLALPG